MWRRLFGCLVLAVFLTVSARAQYASINIGEQKDQVIVRLAYDVWITNMDHRPLTGRLNGSTLPYPIPTGAPFCLAVSCKVVCTNLKQKTVKESDDERHKRESAEKADEEDFERSIHGLSRRERDDARREHKEKLRERKEERDGERELRRDDIRSMFTSIGGDSHPNQYFPDDGWIAYLPLEPVIGRPRPITVQVTCKGGRINNKVAWFTLGSRDGTGQGAESNSLPFAPYPTDRKEFPLNMQGLLRWQNAQGQILINGRYVPGGTVGGIVLLQDIGDLIVAADKAAANAQALQEDMQRKALERLRNAEPSGGEQLQSPVSEPGSQTVQNANPAPADTARPAATPAPTGTVFKAAMPGSIPAPNGGGTPAPADPEPAPAKKPVVDELPWAFTVEERHGTWYLVLRPESVAIEVEIEFSAQVKSTGSGVGVGRTHYTNTIKPVEGEKGELAFPWNQVRAMKVREVGGTHKRSYGPDDLRALAQKGGGR